MYSLISIGHAVWFHEANHFAFGWHWKKSWCKSAKLGEDCKKNRETKGKYNCAFMLLTCIWSLNTLSFAGKTMVTWATNLYNNAILAWWQLFNIANDQVRYEMCQNSNAQDVKIVKWGKNPSPWWNQTHDHNLLNARQAPYPPSYIVKVARIELFLPLSNKLFQGTSTM